ncbi:16S rRNA processing protein RimM [Segatella baroniae F0067]|uniref:Ribosome maturation factor RimM n=1 Tax=Segatella baroniae F0067 TaxID=1115809 RepID=U2P4K5_9BACT|nr:ribosome maturation factor RimM [Segatella baroniae]ERK39086.1 16S rRNA processing protein RimM [Segatella baroniae F0067]
MIKKEDVYKIGKLGKPHGVKGEVRMLCTDDIFDRVESDCLILEIDGILVPFFMEEYRFRSDERVLVKFADIDTEAQARELTGCEVYFPREQADRHEGEATWAELVGYALVDARRDTLVGTITRVDDTTINILFEVETADGREVLVPASEELIEQVDKARHRIHVRMPEGILEL